MDAGSPFGTSASPGVGQLLIDELMAEMRAQRWSRVYRATRENNYRARRLYDKHAQHSGFLRYVIENPEKRSASGSTFRGLT